MQANKYAGKNQRPARKKGLQNNLQVNSHIQIFRNEEDDKEATALRDKLWSMQMASKACEDSLSTADCERSINEGNPAMGWQKTLHQPLGQLCAPDARQLQASTTLHVDQRK